MELQNISYTSLERYSYRNLQQIAKSCGLPSNVKKVYLIEMLIAKKHCTEEQLSAIISRVKDERQKIQSHNKKNKKKVKRVQAYEISSTSHQHTQPQSPPISGTPRRSFFLQYTPDVTISKYQPKKTTQKTLIPKLKESDRILRSFNSKKSSYGILECKDTLIKIVKAQNAMQVSQEIRSSERALNLCVPKSVQRKVLNASVCLKKLDPRILPEPKNVNTQQPPTKRQRTVSGIYPLLPADDTYYHNIPAVSYRRNDGKVTKINALVRVPRQIQQYHPIKVTMQEVINRKVDNTILPKIDYKQTNREHGVLAIEHKLQINQNQKPNNKPKVNNERNPTTAYTDSQSLLKPLNASDCYGTNALPTCVTNSLNNNRTNALKNKALNNCDDSTLQTYGKHALKNSGKNAMNYGTNVLNTSGKSGTNTLNASGKSTLNYETNALSTSGKSALNYGTNTLNTSGKSALNYGTNALNTSGKSVLNYGTNALNASGTNTLCYATNSKSTENLQAKPHTIESPILNTNTYTNVPINDFNTDNGDYTVYYHKKIRSEQVRRVNVREDTLPRINKVFSQFNEVQYRSLTQPLYVQVSQESERFPQHYLLGNENTSMLETLYNFKQQFVINRPLLTVATTSNTRCVFSTNTAPTAVLHPTSAFNEYNNISYERANPYNYNMETETKFYDYMRMAKQEQCRREFTCDEELSRSSSVDSNNSQELGTNATIPEMVEDALEIISQDGDYMERLGLDARMQCVLCEWAGAKIILEFHVKQTHQKEILYKNSPNFTVELTLGALVSHEIWLSNVIEYKDNLYVVSTNYKEDYISVILTTLSEPNTPINGQITIYNKITGKPFTWEGEILPIPDTLPFTSSFHCLKLDITSLDLLPNSANLKLVNKELKLVSDGKVVIGQPLLNDIDIVLHVTVFD